MKNIIQSFKIVFLGLIVAIGISYAFAWTSPGQDPPLGNVSAPVNISSATQYKAGAFGVGGVFQTYTDTYLASSGGNVGIGTPAPIERMDVMGNLFISGTNKGLRLQNDIGSSFWTTTPQDGMMSIGGTGGTPPSSGPLNILATGNVGIGTIAPAEKLDVVGNIKASGTVCDANGCIGGGGGTRTVSGVVDSTGAILLGSGFTVVKTGTSYYDITFNTPFASKPVVVATQDSSGGAAYFEQDPLSSASKVRVWTLDSSGNSAARDFSFIAIDSGSAGGGGGVGKAWITISYCNNVPSTGCPSGWTQYSDDASGTCDENGGDRRWTRRMVSCYKNF
ncbi:MAG: hypothetical protein NUV64_00705 [Parcubacteria group bacterium]|nr:hypothetical protein [Parcubacteria group bacterium]MCR4342630.1 hypothetical protein [Patescibacteria group bacterium]